MPARRERMMAASALPTAHHEIVPPRVVSRPLVPQSAPEEKPKAAETTQPLIFGSQAPKPAIRFASETEVREALGAATVAEPKAQAVPAPVVAAPVIATPVVATPVAAEPVVEAPVQRPTYPVSSYYETARQQAWHELPRVEYTPHPAEDFGDFGPSYIKAVEEPKAVVIADTPTAAAPVPMVVEHIPQAVEQTESELAAEAQGKASVFDDEFFRKPKEEAAEAKAAEEVAPKAWPDARIPSFAGYASEPAAESDELDIPAFLRRKQ
jgi:hypothetical protein